jgi:hypothetical protein
VIDAHLKVLNNTLLILCAMKLYERYSKFRDPAALKEGIVRSVYASMALETRLSPTSGLENVMTSNAVSPMLGQR